MARYIVNTNGSIETDTPEAALAMARLLMGASAKAHKAPEEDVGRSAPDRAPPVDRAQTEEVGEPSRNTDNDAWSRFVGLLKDKQRETLRAIKAHDNITLTELVAALGAEHTSSVAGYLTGIIRNAEKAEVKIAEVFKRSEQGYGPKRVIRYKAGALLRSHEVPA